MKFAELIRKRYSVRSYKPEPVEDNMLAQVLEAARLAPSASNRQPYQLIVVRTAGREKELKRIYSGSFFAEAPLIICACALPSKAWSRRDGTDYSHVDIAIAMDHLVLAAAELGLGTCWIAAFDPDAARDVLALPAEAVPVVFTPLGYPADTPGVKNRKPLSELIRYEHW
jgi:nitroreductase